MTPMSILFAVLLQATPAPQLRPVRLLYRRDPGAERCPDEEALRRAISRRLGQDPFRSDANRLLSVVIGASGPELVAHVALRREGAAQAGERRLTSTPGDCGELFESISLAASIALDPLGMVVSSEPPPAPPPAPAAPPPPAPTPTPVVLPEPEPTPRRTWTATLGISGLLGAGPGPTLGGSVGGRLQGERFSLGLEASAELPSTKQVSSGEVEASRAQLGLLGCVHARWVGACALGLGGVQRGLGRGLAAPRAVATPAFGVGGRVEVVWPETGPLAGGLHAELQVPLTRTTLRVDGQEAWSTPPLAGLLGLRLLGRFE